MKCLWLTRKYPRPVNSGELIYSDGLIRAFAATEADLTVIAHDNDEKPIGDGSSSSIYHDDDSVEWRLGTPELGSRITSLFTKYPADTWRLKNGGPEKAFRKAFLTEDWDAIIIDHAAIGWAMNVIRQLRQSRTWTKIPVIVYVSHNHEAKIRPEIAKNSTEIFPKKLAQQYDAEKYARQENMLCREVDLVTAITETEVAAYRENFPDQKFLCLTPGYDGVVAATDEKISDKTPRRVVMSGSFEWIAKRINLDIFLGKAARSLLEAGIEVQIVGKTEESFRLQMVEKYPGIEFTGRVPEMTPYLLDARMGLIVEEFGGGFKLKALDYIFHGLPLAGLEKAVDGLPLSSPEHILLETDTETLVSSIIDCIDDMDRLNRMRDMSLEICRESFQWETRGNDLYERIAAMDN